MKPQILKAGCRPKGENMLLPLKFCAFTRAFSARNNQVSERRESCGRLNMLYWLLFFRSSVAAVSRQAAGARTGRPAGCCAGKKRIKYITQAALLGGFLLLFSFILISCVSAPQEEGGGRISHSRGGNEISRSRGGDPCNCRAPAAGSFYYIWQAGEWINLLYQEQ
ncbi:hypothetical protein ES708_22806 [subsurface metagenome]